MNATTILFVTFVMFNVIVGWLMNKINDKEHECYMEVVGLAKKALQTCDELSKICNEQNELLKKLEADKNFLMEEND